MYQRTDLSRHRSLAWRHLLLGCVLVVAHQTVAAQSMAVSAVVVSKSNCRFSTAGASTLNFGLLNPSSTTSVSVSTTRTFRCGGSASTATYAFTADDGANALGAGLRRMRHGTVTTEYMRYALTLSPASGTVAKNVTQTLTITGTVTPSEFADVLAGAYSDTVTLTLSP